MELNSTTNEKDTRGENSFGRGPRDLTLMVKGWPLNKVENRTQVVKGTFEVKINPIWLSPNPPKDVLGDSP